MNRRTLVVLVAALAILAIVAAVVLRGAQTGSRDQGLLVPGLKEQLNGIAQIVVTGPGNAPIATLARGAENWTVVERGNYAADVGRIRRNLLALAEARIVEEKTSDPDFYDRLGVQDVSADTAKGVQLTLTGSGKPVSVIIGLAPSGSTTQTYARRAGEPRSWLVTGQFDLGKTGGEWLDRSITDIPAGRIQSVTITHPGLETLRISRDPKTDPKTEKSPASEGMVEFLVADVPAGRELSYPGIANGVAGVLAELQLDDAQARAALGANPGKPIVARFVTTDGLAVETSAWRLPDGTRFTFIASAAGEGDGDAAKEAAAINARLGGWVYTVPSYKAEQLTRRLEELLAPASSR